MNEFELKKGIQKLKIYSPEQMQALGAAVSKCLTGGDIVLLSGELGAGKTVFCKGLAKGLGVTEHVVSPTFTIMNEYFGKVEFCHFDAYRLADADEAEASGLCDYIGNKDCICAVEWWEIVSPLFDGLKTVKVNIAKAGDDVREVTVEL